MKSKKIVILGIIFLAITLFLAGCSLENNNNEENYRFIKIYEKGSVKIFYDKETKVEYAVRSNGYGGTSMTLLVNADGKPLLYED